MLFTTTLITKIIKTKLNSYESNIGIKNISVLHSRSLNIYGAIDRFQVFKLTFPYIQIYPDK